MLNTVPWKLEPPHPSYLFRDPIIRRTFISITLETEGRHFILFYFAKVAGLVTEVCAGLREPHTARSSAESRREGARAAGAQTAAVLETVGTTKDLWLLWKEIRTRAMC